MKIKKKIFKLSKYVYLVKKTLFLKKKKKIFYFFKQADYVSILAYTKKKKFLLVKQYRPAIQKFTIEIPGGLVDKGEKPINAAKRELKEETGYYAKKLVYLGSFYVDVGRLENKIHCYFAKNLKTLKKFKKENDLEIIEADLYEFSNLIRKKKIMHFIHVGIIALANLKKLINIKI